MQKKVHILFYGPFPNRSHYTNYQDCNHITYPIHRTEALVNPLVPFTGRHILIFG